jgi:type I restriction enzyme S subunit
MVTLRKNRRLRGFTEAIYEFGYQGIRKGDLVIHAMDAFAGAIGVSDSDGKGTPVYLVCQPKPDINPHYYAMVVREMARTQWIQALSRGIRERSTDFRYDTFGGEEVLLPPPDEQAAIVRFLDHANHRIDRFIRTKKKIIALLNEQKQAIIHGAVTRGIDPDVRMKDSGIPWLGEIPEHWEILALKNVLNRLIDCEHKTAPIVENSEYRVLRTTGIRNGLLRIHGTYCTTKSAYLKWTRRGLPEAGDVVFTREAPAGEACLVPKELTICLGQRTVLMKLKKNRIDSSFLVHLIYAGPPRTAITLATQGSTVGHFNMSDIGALPVFLPPIQEQEEIVTSIIEQTMGLFEIISRTEKELDLIRGV